MFWDNFNNNYEVFRWFWKCVRNG